MTTDNPVFEKIQGLLFQADNQLKNLSANEPLHPIEADLLKDQLKMLYLSVLAATMPHTDTATVPAADTKPATPSHEEATPTIMPTFIATEEVAEKPTPAPKPEPTPKPEPDPKPVQSEKAEEPAPIVVPPAKPVVEEPLFAPEPEPEPTPTMEPMMEEIAGNPFGALFDMGSDEPETPKPAPKSKKESKKEKEKEAAPAPETPKSDTPAESSLLNLLRQQADQSQSMTLGERLSQQTDTSNAIDQRVAHNKVSDLRTVININDKFSFMTNLFRNNMKAYNDFILRLNAIESREEALEHVRMVAKDFGWDMESPTVQNFYALLDRKF